MRGMYRFHIPDPIYFQQNIKVTVQQIGMSHNGLFERRDDVSSVAYWYRGRQGDVKILSIAAEGRKMAEVEYYGTSS